MVDLKYLIVYGENDRKLIYIKPNNLKLGDYISYIRKIHENKLVKHYKSYVSYDYVKESFFGVFIGDEDNFLELLDKEVKYFIDFQNKPDIFLLVKDGLRFSFSKEYRNKTVTYLIYIIWTIIKLDIETKDFKHFEIKNINKTVTFKDLCKIKLDKLDIVDKLISD